MQQAEQAMTYGELAERAERIALHLLGQGLQRGEVVAVTGQRSLGLIPCMLGVFMSGGVLLTIDEQLPIKRRQIMLRAAEARRMLSLVTDGADVWREEELSVTDISPESGRIIGAVPPSAEETSLPVLSGDDPAYIFFTSGSTGEPKAVLGCHKGLAHFLDWQRTTFGIGRGDRFSQLTALSFDVMLREIFTPLTGGATLCLPSDDILDAERIVSWLDRERITAIHLVPAVAQSWLAVIPPSTALCHLRYVFFAGEPLQEALVRQWRAVLSETAEIVNLYGPTETTLAKCCYRVPAEPLPGVQPVGAPLPQTQALVLNGYGGLCGPGEPGEIFLRTPFRSLGYLRPSPEDGLRLVRNPFRDMEGDLLYRTGDLGRYMPDGTLEILGRFDHQVKIHGVRIELGEIEAALNAHPAVQEAAVLARDCGRASDEKRLIAYVVPVRGKTPAAGEVRNHLREKLPDYMLPSAFVFMASLPLMPNGKVDRSALPAPEAGGLDGGEAHVAPRTPTEESLAGIWAEILGVGRIGVHDNFFELGGHSLLATQVLSRLRGTFEVDMPVRVLFEAPTVAELAERIELIRWAAEGIQPRVGEENEEGIV